MVQLPVPARPPAHRFTVAEYYAMAEAGILHEDDRVELLAGEVVQMVPIGSRHNAVVDRLNQLLVSQAGGNTIVRTQGSIRLDDHSEPQPDVTLLRPRPDFYANAHPGPGDVLLIVEVMQSSADYDRSVKIPVYARAGIPEVWLIDLDADTVEVFQSPDGALYRDLTPQLRGDAIAVPGLPGIAVPVEQILGSHTVS